MLVKALDYVVYGADGRNWRPKKITHPSWQQIEKSIRRLDRHQYPFLFLWLSDDEDKQVFDGSSDGFNIIGGKGAYWLACTSVSGKYFERHYVNPIGSNDEIAVWTSDQGFSTVERNVCCEIETVVRVARYYASHAELDPAFEWADN